MKSKKQDLSSEQHVKSILDQNDLNFSQRNSEPQVGFAARKLILRRLLRSIVVAVTSLLLLLKCGSDKSVEISNDPAKGSEVNDVVLRTERLLLEKYLDESNVKTKPNYTTQNFDFKKKKIDYTSIEPILRSNCYSCHRPKGSAPFSLMDYEVVKKKALAINDVIREDIMPPWKADNNYAFANAPQMTDHEKAKILYWLENSCSPGEVEVNNSTIKLKPFLSIPNKNTYQITSTEDSYVYSTFDPGLSEDLRLSHIDFVENNPTIVHHRTLFIDTTGLLLPENTSQKEYDELLKDLKPIFAWSKGMIPSQLTNNFYYNVPAKSKFLLQTHYQGDGNLGKKDVYSLNLYKSDSNGHEIKFKVNNKFDIHYPANRVMTETLSCHIKDSISITGIIPHMHYLCKKMECYAVYEGEKIELLSIPDWDYYFQGQYIFKTPRSIPAGATIYMTIVIDNTINNISQPNNPIRDVTYAQSSNDEMFTMVLLHTTQTVDSSLRIAKPIYQ